MVQEVRDGYSYRVVARRWQVSVATVALWVGRAKGRRLAEVDWRDRPSGARRMVGRTSASVIAAIGRARRYLQRHDALGEHGPAAIRRYLWERGVAAPCERTIARWLARRGWSGRERWRRPPPPKAWYLPEVAAGSAELDSCDIVEGLCLRGSRQVEVLNIIGLWSASVATTAAETITTTTVIAALQQRWQQDGCPAFLQCDNDPVFTGGHARHHFFGRLVHWCLCAGVVPVFTPPAELGFQASIEAYNRRWQERVWRRWRHRNLAALRQRSAAFVAAYTARTRARAQPIPRQPWQAPSHEPRVQRIILLRRLEADGTLLLAAQRLHVAPAWAHRLVRCELDLRTHKVRIHGLRRRDPSAQPFLREHPLRLQLVPWHRATPPDQ